MRGQEFLCCILLAGTILKVDGDSNFAGAAISSDSSGTKSILVSGKNGAAGVGVLSSRFGGGNPGVRVGSGYGGGAYASAGAGGASASAGPAGAYAGPGGAYAGPGPWGFPYWNGGGAYASSSAGDQDYNYPYNYDYPYEYGVRNRYGSGNGVGVYSSSDSDGLSTRFASVGSGGHATIVEQNGNEAPRVYTYRGVNSNADEDFGKN